MSTWLTVEEALEKLLGYVRPLEAEAKPILEALGQVLAGDVVSSLDIPPLPNSAMDGYAVRWQDIRGATPAFPKVLPVIGELPAGTVPDREVSPGTAIRIMTGAPIPPGADTVVPFEETDEEQRQEPRGKSQKIGILKEMPKETHIRPAGEDIRRGETVLKIGATLGPAEIGVLATIGRSTVQVIRRPAVAILATGDELVAPGEELSPGRIYDTNSYSIAAQVVRYGGIPKLLGIARDTVGSVVAKVQKGLEADMVVTSAGVSQGDYDLVKDVLAQQGEIAFWTVRMRPAKPLAFGVLYQRDEAGKILKRVPHLGLPGNPVSAMIAFHEFGRAAILKMLGKPVRPVPTINAILETPIQNPDGRRVYARVTLAKRGNRHFASLTGPQGSHVMTSLTKADGLAICPEDVEVIKAGEMVKVQILRPSEEPIFSNGDGNDDKHG